MENDEDIFKANGYHSEAYHALNHSYQEKMTDLFSRRQIDYPMKQLEFEVDTVKMTSTMSQQQYLKLQGFVEAFPQKQRNGTTPVVGKDDYQSIIYMTTISCSTPLSMSFAIHWGSGTPSANTFHFQASRL